MNDEAYGEFLVTLKDQCAITTKLYAQTPADDVNFHHWLYCNSAFDRIFGDAVTYLVRRDEYDGLSDIKDPYMLLGNDLAKSLFYISKYGTAENKKYYVHAYAVAYLIWWKYAGKERSEALGALIGEDKAAYVNEYLATHDVAEYDY